MGGAVGPPDANCNPTITPPSSGGCVWYNFTANTDNTITSGSSFTNYYVDAGNPAWTFTSVGPVIWRILDGGHQGDTFDAFDNGVFLGTTSSTPIDANHSCANDQTGMGTNPAACWNDPLMSRGQFQLGTGAHSLTVVWDQRVPGGNSTLQWFELQSGTIVPEPTAFLMVGAGLVCVAMIRRRPRVRR
jgi:hypothetical protein